MTRIPPRALIRAVTLAVVLATAPTLAAPAGAARTTTNVLQPALVSHLDDVSASTPVRVMIQAGGSLETAKQAVASAGLSPEISLDRIGMAVAIGTPAEVSALASTDGVTRVDWADQPLEYFSNTSHIATRAKYLHDGAVDVDGDGTLDKFTGKGFSVAIVDSGTDGTHPMFADANGDSRVKKNMKVICHDLVGDVGSIFLKDEAYHTAAECLADVTAANDTDTPSGGGHGTHVTGIAAGGIVTDSTGRHLRGAAPEADIVSLSTGYTITVLSGVTAMYWVLDHHADPCGDGSCGPVVAVNNSWGVSDTAYSADSPEDVVARALVADGVVVTFAAGNDGGDGSAVATNPFGLDPTPGIISVANYDDANSGTRDNDLDSSSSRGKSGAVATYPDISAPGANITSACRPYLPVCSTGLDTGDPNYNTISGTSMATPHITGYVALLQQVAAKKLGRMLTPGEIENLMVDTAYHFGSRTYQTDTRNPGSTTGTTFDAGHGLVDMAAAVEKLTGAHVTVSNDGPVCTPTAEFTDPEGDATGGFGQSIPGGPDAKGIDITRAWLTADPTTSDVTFHWKVSDLAATPGGAEGTGEYFDFNFSFGGAGYYITASRLTEDGGESFVLGDFSGTQGGRKTLSSGLPGSFNPTTDEIRATLPAATWAGLGKPGILKPGAIVSGLSLVGRRSLVLLVPDADKATGPCAYTVGAENVVGPVNTAPSAKAGVDHATGYPGEQFVFSSTGTTDTETPANLTYTWSFGDGTASAQGATVSHTYSAVGTYTATLTVTDPSNASDTDTTVVTVRQTNRAPEASALADHSTVEVESDITFDASGSSDPDGDALTYAWDFGDGDSTLDARGARVTTSYDEVGDYTATVTVTDSAGASDTATVVVHVVPATANTPPTADVVATPDIVLKGDTVVLKAKGSYDNETAVSDLKFEWDFDDEGSTVDATSRRARATYTTAGVKIVTLTITDEGGLVDTQSVRVEVLRKLNCQNEDMTLVGWRKVRSDRADKGSYCDTFTKQTGVPTADFTTNGDAMQIVYGRARNGGAADVIVDGLVVGRIDFSSDTKRVTFGWTKTFVGLGAGDHDVTIEMVSRKSDGFLDYVAF